MLTRLRFALIAVFFAFVFTARPASARPTVSLVIHADAVNYYSNRFVLTADGNVRVSLSDGTIVSGETFAMDLKLNRYVVAGNVHVDGSNVHLTGAALAGFPDIDRIYFIPEGDVPDRWTFFGQDFTDRHEGRQQPGDAFNLYDVGPARPFIKGKSVTVYLKNNIEFPPGSLLSVSGAYVPTPGWVVNFSQNPNFYQNGYAGAVFDIQIPFIGSANAITAFDIRYVQPQGAFISFEQHIVHNQDYYVFTINPLTQDFRQWNLIAYHRWSPALETRLYSTLFTQSTWPWKEPNSASGYTNFNVNTRVGKYAVGITANQYNDSFLPVPSVGDDAGDILVHHPFNVQIAVQSFEDEIRFFRRLGVPIKFQYRAGYGWNYDGYGITSVNGSSTWNGALYPLIAQTFVGATVYTPSIRLFKQTSISVKYDKQREWYSLPHHVDTDTFTATLAYTPQTTKSPAAYLAYNVLNIGDFYGADQLIAYPPFEGNVPGQPGTYTNQYGTFTGLDAFRGFATSRSLTGSAVYTPNQYIAFNLTMQYFDVTPAPVPGLSGQAPYQFTGDVRFRVTPNLLIDVARTYSFNFGGLGWSTNPNFAVTFSP